MKFSISVVSHRSGPLIGNLFDDLRQQMPEGSEILLTLNCPEDEGFLAKADRLPIRVLRNPRPLGFGANHNQAFACSRGEKFVIVNPDIRLRQPLWATMSEALQGDVGACAPMVVAPGGAPEDSVRRYPSIRRLFRRAVLQQRSADYHAAPDRSPIAVEWVAGMFVMFDADCFRAIRGFDTKYFMYMEDVDICRRLNAMGKRVLWLPTCTVVHDAQRASHRSWEHRRWHARSAVRFLTGL